MAKSKLYRNLKPGDRFKVETGYGIKQYLSAVVTVSSVEKVGRNRFSGKQQWAVYGDYPWWWGRPIHAESSERCELWEG